MKIMPGAFFMVKETMVIPIKYFHKCDNRKLYWVDGKKGAIYVSELNGTNRRTLLRRGVNRPRSIISDPANG